MAKVGFWSLLLCGLAAAIAQIGLPKANNRIAIITSFFTKASTENGCAKTGPGDSAILYEVNSTSFESVHLQVRRNDSSLLNQARRPSGRRAFMDSSFKLVNPFPRCWVEGRRYAA